MTFDFYEPSFRSKAVKAGYSEDDIQRCLEYAKPLIKKKLPVIYNTQNLSAYVGYNKYYLKKAALFTNSFYREFAIKKKSGKLRYLKEPLPSLKEIQLWILDNILYEIPVSRFAKAYIPGKSIIDNVRLHKNKKYVLTLDIENFFSSISIKSIEYMFQDFGYSSNVSNLLSKLCCCDDRLPQGAPTSPYLSNIYLTSFDNKVSNYCVNDKIRYTRYADDLTFSGRFDYKKLIDFVKTELARLALKLNDEKVKLAGQNDRQLVTGIVVNEKLQIPKKNRQIVRQELYYIKKFGLTNHLIKTNNNRGNYLKHLLGKINYALYINPNDNEMKQYQSYLQTELKNFDDSNIPAGSSL